MISVTADPGLSERAWSECPLCASTRCRTEYDFSASTSSGAVPGYIVACLDCGLQYKIPSFPEIPLSHYYADQSTYLHRDDPHEADKEFERILQQVGPPPRSGARLLDVGSGPGRFLGAAMRAGFIATGVELNPALAQSANVRYDAEVLAGDAQALPELLAGREETFDVVTLLDLIEHVRDPVTLLREAANFLAPGGVMLVYTPNHQGLIVRTAVAIRALSLGWLEGPLRGIYDCDHIVFFTPDSLCAAVCRAGLSPGRMTRVRFNPYRRGIARGATAQALRAIESVSPWLGGEFRMMLRVHRAAQD